MGDGLDEESDWFFSVYIFKKRKFKEVPIQKLICAMKKKQKLTFVLIAFLVF